MLGARRQNNDYWPNHFFHENMSKSPGTHRTRIVQARGFVEWVLFFPAEAITYNWSQFNFPL